MKKFLHGIVQRTCGRDTASNEVVLNSILYNNPPSDSGTDPLRAQTDVLYAGEGDDILIGGKDNDTLIGGSGSGSGSGNDYLKSATHNLELIKRCKREAADDAAFMMQRKVA